METTLIALLGLFMGIVTAISGGAGVFAVPAMLAFGLPPISALALNRVSDVGVVFGALKNYISSKKVDWRLAGIAVIPLSLGSFLGASAIVRAPEDILRPVIIAGVLVGIIFILKKPRDVGTRGTGRISFAGLFFLLLVGLWSGALAMAGATFAVLVMVHFFGKSFLSARSTDIVAVIPETLISSSILLLHSSLSWQLPMAMFAGSLTGAWLGSHLAVRHGDAFIKKFMVAVALLMIAKVVLDINLARIG